MSEGSLRLTEIASRIPKFSLGFVVLVFMLLAGDKLSQWLALSIPPAIIGMVLLLIVLGIFGRLAPTAEAAGKPLLRHMMLFFIPAVVGVMEQFQALKSGWLPFVVASIAGAALTLVVTAFTLEKLMKRQEAVE
ncbi:CidA/LrgA family protein [Ottowia thiooxydans]|uniref:CidA/LrgA family protein n=1 Tax=Ottowia thiooxydans TaxID=219182 RepID=UPI0009FC92F4|nr:CidA/LrgA family protein [Ottowia thiooxydans]